MKISVALCSYNGEAFIRDQLISIAKQTRIPDEIILCDDRSSDRTMEIVFEVCENTGLPIKTHINETRLGLEANFSQAMIKTTGDVVFFCDQDDVWLPSRIEQMVAPFEKDPSTTLVYTDGWITGQDLEPSGYTLFLKNPSKNLKKGDDRNIGERLIRGQAPGIKASAMAFSSKVRDLAGPIPKGLAHDSWIAFFGYALGKVVSINKPLHYYRRHDQTFGGSSSNALIQGLTPKVKPKSKLEYLTEKSHFARCLHERMEYLLYELSGKEYFPQRYFQLERDTEKAVHVLSTRANIVKTPELFKRIMKGLSALRNGIYDTEGGWKRQINACLQDIFR